MRPALLLFVVTLLLAACQPASHGVSTPMPEIPTSTPPPTETPTSSPSPTETPASSPSPTEAPQTNQVEKIALEVIYNQDRYAELVLPLPEEAQRAVHLEIAHLINENKTLNPQHVNGFGRKMGYDPDRNEWVYVGEYPNEKYPNLNVPQNINPAEQAITLQFFVPGRSQIDSGQMGYEIYDHKTEEWKSIDLTVIMENPMTSSRQQAWLDQFMTDSKLKNTFSAYFAERPDRTALVIPVLINGSFKEGIPVPNSSVKQINDEIICDPFVSMTGLFPVFDTKEHLLGFLQISFFVDSVKKFNLQVAEGGRQDIGKQRVANTYTWTPTWNSHPGNQFEGSAVILVEGPQGFSTQSTNPKRGEEKFPEEMGDIEQFLKVCNASGCSLKELREMKASWFAFGLYVVVACPK
jgi:hypothetical protein